MADRAWGGDLVIDAARCDPCLACGGPAAHVSASFEAAVCSPGCLDTLWAGLDKAIANGPAVPPEECP
jgi:hypothetical protein